MAVRRAPSPAPPAMRIDLKKLGPRQQAELKAALDKGPVRLSELSEQLLSTLAQGFTGFAQTEEPREEDGFGWKHIPDPTPRHASFHEYGARGVPARPFFNYAATPPRTEKRKPLTPPPWAQPWCAKCGRWVTDVESIESALSGRIFIVKCHGQREETAVPRADVGKVKGYGVAFGGAR